jgi:sec-independent protein translocase protein TatC
MPLDQSWNDDDEHEDFAAGGKEMTFIDHLEELRWHILRAVLAIGVFTIISLVFIQEIFDYVVMAPANPNFWTYRMLCKAADFLHVPALCVQKFDFILINTEVGGQFSLALTSALVIGLLFAFPYAFWELWRFIKPGLKKTEVDAANGAVFWVTLLFFTGVLFGYYIVTPLTINFLLNFRVSTITVIKDNITIDSFISILVTLTLACGIVFELPVAAFVLSKVGFLTPKFMSNYRRHAFVVILIVAAVITPSADPWTQIVVTIPLVFLYEISILVSARVERQKLKEQAEL